MPTVQCDAMLCYVMLCPRSALIIYTAGLGTYIALSNNNNNNNNGTPDEIKKRKIVCESLKIVARFGWVLIGWLPLIERPWPRHGALKNTRADCLEEKGGRTPAVPHRCLSRRLERRDRKGRKGSISESDCKPGAKPEREGGGEMMRGELYRIDISLVNPVTV